MSSEEMSLLTWEGDWGLPSVDHQCLAAMAYCKFADVPVEINKTNNPWKSPTGLLPLLTHGEEKVYRNTAIFNYLRKQQWGIEHSLNNKQSADAVAYIAMIEEKLLPALLHLWWVDNRTYTELTRPWFSKVLPFPLNMYLPTKTHNDCINRLQLTKGGSEEERKTEMYKEAKECINLLSTKLGDKSYFFGQRPSLLDAVVFGYLAPLLKAPFPNGELQNHLKACTNLCHHTQNILDRYFPLSPEELEELEKKEAERKEKVVDADVDPDFPNKKRNIIIGGAVALTAMMGYAVWSGLVPIEIVASDRSNGNKSPEAGAVWRAEMFDENDDGESEGRE